MLSAEDAVGDTIRPRLEAAGADLNLVEVLEAIHDEKNGAKRSFNLKDDLDKLETAIADYGDVVLVTLDPITSYLGRGVDSHQTADVRAVLEPLASFSERTGVAVLAVSHPPKAPQAKAINSITGSLAFVAAARVVLLVVADPDDDDRSLLLPVKNNLSGAAEGMGYRLVQRPITGGIIASHVHWDTEPVDISASEALRASHAGAATKLEEAKTFLREQLSGGPASPDAIITKGATVGLSEKTLRRAKRSVGIVAKKDGFSAGWTWELPEP